LLLKVFLGNGPLLLRFHGIVLLLKVFLGNGPLLLRSHGSVLLLKVFLGNGPLLLLLSLWELNNYHVFVVAEVCVPFVAVAQRYT
jgi:hypothetical protein